jgi:hypothetical protein
LVDPNAAQVLPSSLDFDLDCAMAHACDKHAVAVSAGLAHPDATHAHARTLSVLSLSRSPHSQQHSLWTTLALSELSAARR